MRVIALIIPILLLCNGGAVNAYAEPPSNGGAANANATPSSSPKKTIQIKLEKQEKWTTAFSKPENAFNLDVYWLHEQIKRNFFNTVPKLGKQRNSTSDITNTSEVTIFNMI